MERPARQEIVDGYYPSATATPIQALVILTLIQELLRLGYESTRSVPTGQPQQDIAAGPHVWHGCAALAGGDRAQNVDPRHNCSKAIGSPAYKREYAARCKRQDAPPPIENLFLSMATEANPVLDALLEPKKLDMGEITHAGSPSAEKDCRASVPFSCGACVSIGTLCCCRSAAPRSRSRRQGASSSTARASPPIPMISSIAMIRSDARRPPARCAQRRHPNRWHFEPAPIALDRAS
jgi:hypothetical protein